MRNIIRTAGTPLWATLTPVLCVIHCLSAPLIATLAPAFATTPAFEATFMTLAALLAVPLLRTGHSTHARLGPSLLACIGTGLWILHLLGGTPTLVTGGLALSASLLWDRRLRQTAQACDCPVCEARS